jgi:ubiquinone biosynthesis protein
LRIRRLRFISRTSRHLQRYRQILTVLFKYGFGELVDRMNVAHYFETGLQMVSKSRRERMEKLTRSERLRLAVEELGPTFIKLAQVLSTRPDLIPVEFAQELTKLQDQVPAFPFEQANQIIEEELKAPLAEKFPHFEKVPLAAASIAQVHRARLADGREVVVKIQRPGIARLIEVDVEILYHLATLMERHIAELGIQRPTGIVEEFARTLEKEIDFTVEANHLERFARQFRETPGVYIPQVHRPLSTRRVLTMEYIQGVKVSDLAGLEAAGHDRKLLAARGAEIILEQILRFGFFHADPHPGNVFILPGNLICYLDFGMMGSVDRQSREDFADLIFAYLGRDEKKVAHVLLRVMEYDEEPNRRALEKDLADFLEGALYPPLKKAPIASLLKVLLELIHRHRLRIPADIFLMIKALATTEAVGYNLDPDFDLAGKTEPFIRRIVLERLNPRRLLEEFFRSGEDLIQLLREIPGETRDILHQFRQGKVKIGFEHRGLENFAFHLDRASNRIAFSLVIAALIVGSSIIIQTRIGPYLFGFSMLGLFGFLVAGILGLWLLISILRSGRL